MAGLRAELVDAWRAPIFDPDRIGVINGKIRALLALMGVQMKEEKADGRRFTNKWSTDPGSVKILDRDHPAMKELRTIFPHSVVNVDEKLEEALLVSGKHSRKLGKTVNKGRFKDYEIFQFTLEERATCPVDCEAMRYCYGNGMQWARRNRITDIDVFAVILEQEIEHFFEENPGKGMLVRLHVLGDFFSVDYCYVWKEMLDKFPKLAVFGCTHRRPTERGREDKIGDAIQVMKAHYGERFRIRWSRDRPVADGTMVIANMPKAPRIYEGIVCPAQREAQSTCASCALCWENDKDTIVFIAHGPKDMEQAAQRAMDAGRVPLSKPAAIEKVDLYPPPAVKPALKDATPPPEKFGSMRLVAPIQLAAEVAPIITKIPELRMVPPTSLFIEEDYQRELGAKSIAHIRNIAVNWDWNSYKAPNCFEIGDGLACSDGQHTAIAAASRGDIPLIPVLVGGEATLQQRAAAFVSINKDRLTMTQFQIFHGRVTAGHEASANILRIIRSVGGEVPKYQNGKRFAKPGWITVVSELYRVYEISPELLKRTAAICVKTGIKPIQKTLFSGVREILQNSIYRDVARMRDDAIVFAIKEIRNIEMAALQISAEKGVSRFRGAAEAIARQARKQ